MRHHYLDHASTSPLRPAARQAIADWLDGPFADPARVHEEARVVRAAIEEARQQVADLAGVRARQVIFTSGGTESINTAVFGACRARPGSAVLCADVEHPAVREASGRFGVRQVLAVDGCGRIDPLSVAEVLAGHEGSPPALVNCQWANHEVGTVQPVAEVIALCRQAGVPVHVDAAAAFGHLPTDEALAEADLVSVSAHKLGGPPGVGALLLRRGYRVEPLLVGGSQERARRAGLENVLGIVGFGAAAAALSADGGALLTAEATAQRRLTARLLAAGRQLDGVSLVGDPDPSGRLPHVLCLSIDGVEAEPVLLGLDRAGFAAHSGSACSSESLEPSPVHRAMGIDPARTLRLSVGHSTTSADIDGFERALADVVVRLRQLMT